jgi:hypothetical protein
MTVVGSPTFSSGGQGGQNRLITGNNAGLGSGTFNAATLFSANKGTIISVWRHSGSGSYYPMYSSEGFGRYTGVGWENTVGGILMGDWGGNGTARTFVVTSNLGGTTAIRSQIFTGSNAFLRQNGAQVATRAHSTVLSGTHRCAVNGFAYNGSTLTGTSSSANEFYASMMLPSDSVPLAKRLEHSLAYSFKIPCS